MYHIAIEQFVRFIYQRLSKGDPSPLLRVYPEYFAEGFAMAGAHALGGTRHSSDAMRGWFVRLHQLFPDLDFQIKDVVVRGWPWNTTVIVEFIDRAIAADGQPYYNEGVQVLHLRWGRVIRSRIYLDTQRVHQVCERLREQGLLEECPIED